MTLTAPHPVWLPAAPKPTAMVFAALFAIESMARASISTVITVQAYDLLHSTQRVSLLFTSVGFMSLIGTLVIPMLIVWTARRWVYTFGAICLIVAGVALATFTIQGQAAGMLIRVFGAACLNITLSLYILDNIRRSELVRAEPLRLSFSTFSWTLGPALGVWLYTKHGVWAPHIFSGICSTVLLALFWYVRLSDHPAIQPAITKPVNPLASVRRFLAQPRLRLAWLIAFGRSCFWVTFFTFGPLLMVTSGLGKQAGGYLVSAGNAVLITAVLFGKLSERVGVRTVIAGAFVGMAITAFGAGIAGTGHPLIAASLLLLGSIAASAVDGIGSIPFLRAVRHRERSQMTAVYRTYLDMSELLPAAIFSVVLLFAPLTTVFLILGVWAAVCAAVTWNYLPKAM